jgi:hypothetical protein
LKPPTVPSLSESRSTLQPLLGGIALVHPEQIAREKRGLVAARSRPDLEDDAALVGGVLRQQRDQDLTGAGVDLGAGRVALLIGEVPELGIGRGVRDQPLGLGQIGQCLPPGGDRRHDRIELGELLGELDRADRVRGGVDLGGRRGVAGDDGVEAILGELKRHGELETTIGGLGARGTTAR